MWVGVLTGIGNQRCPAITEAKIRQMLAIEESNMRE
jgi:hypothetical protein